MGIKVIKKANRIGKSETQPAENAERKLMSGARRILEESQGFIEAQRLQDDELRKQIFPGARR